MSPATAENITLTPLAANDNGPTDPRICRWRCAIDAFKAKGFTALAIYTAQCKLRGNETFDEFAERLVAELKRGWRQAS